jgi:hypothetical protein
MKTRSLSLVCIFASAVAIYAWGQSEGHWENYKRRTLQSIIEMFPDEHEEFLDSSKNQVLLPGETFPSKVKLAYLAKSRPLPANKKELLTLWTTSKGRPATTVDLFPTEVLFREGTDEHWIAVQKPLLATLPREVKRGQSFDSYVIFIGTIKKVGEQREWLFAMNEFDAP